MRTVRSRVGVLWAVVWAGALSGCASDGSTVAEEIGPQGGQVVLASADGEQPSVTLGIPAGALPSPTTLTIRETTDIDTLPPDVAVAGPAFEFLPSGTQFAMPVTVTVPIDLTRVPEGRTPVMLKQEVNGSRAEIISVVSLDRVAGTIAAQTRSFTKYQGGSVPSTTVSLAPASQSGTPDRDLSSFTASVSRALADGTTAVTLTAIVRDAAGMPIPNVPVSVTTPGVGYMLSPPMATSDAVGRAEFQISSTDIGERLVTARFGAVALELSVFFDGGPPDSTKSQIRANAQTAAADGVSFIEVQVAIKDALDHPLPSQLVSFTATGGAQFAPASGMTDSSGAMKTRVTSTSVGTKSITATAGTATLHLDLTFDNNQPSIAQSTLTPTVEPPPVADGTPVNVVAHIRNSLGADLANVSFDVSSPRGALDVLSTSTATTDMQGTFTFTISSLKAGQTNVHIQPTAGGSFVLDAPIVFAPGPVDEMQTSIMLSTGDVVANGNSPHSLTVNVRDANGNAIGAQNVSVSIVAPNHADGGGLVTDADGNVSYNFASTVAGLHQVTVLVAGFMYQGSVNFVAGPAVSNAAALTASPSNVPADGTTSSTLTLTLVDAFGNPVANTPFTLVVSSGVATLSGAPTQTDVTGVATATIKSNTVGTATVTATAPGFQVQRDVFFTAVSSTASQSNSLVEILPAAISVDGAGAQVRVVVKDSVNALIAGAFVSLSLDEQGVLQPALSGFTNAQGEFKATLTSQVAEVKNLTATVDGSVTLFGSVTFTPGAPSAGTSVVTVLPDTPVADGVSTATIRARFADQFGNPIAGAVVTFGVTGGTNALSSPTATTDALGEAIVTFTSTSAGSKSISATLAGEVLQTTTIFKAGAAVAANSSWTLDTMSPIAADGLAFATATLTLRDAHNNLVPSEFVSVSMTPGASVISPVSGFTDGSGVFSTMLGSTTSGDKTATVTFEPGAQTLDLTITFASGPASNAMSSFTASPTTLVANGIDETQLTLHVADSSGNPVAGGFYILSSSKGGIGTIFTPASGAADAAGDFVVTLRSTKAGVHNVNVMGGAISKNLDVTFSPGAFDFGSSFLIASMGTPIANDTDSATVTMTVRDAAGNPIPNQQVDFGVSGDGDARLSQTTAFSDTNGQAAVQVFSTVAEMIQVSATVEGVQFDEFVMFVAGAPVAANSSLSVTPSTLPADGITQAIVTATFRDDGNNPIVGATVNFSVTGTGNNLVPASELTDSSGQASITLSATQEGSKTVTAAIGSVTRQQPVEFTIPPPSIVSALVSGSGGCVSVDTQVAQPQSRPVDLYYEVDRGGGNFEPAFPAPGLGEGVLRRSTSPTGLTHTFVWNSTANIRSVRQLNARIRVTARAKNVASAPYVIDPVVVDNGVNYAALSPTAAVSAATGFAQGDFDRNGTPDLLVVAEDAALASVVTGIPGGGFNPGMTFAVGAMPTAPRVGDFNRDGKLDFLVGSQDASNLVHVYLGDGNNGFAAGPSFGVSGAITDVAIGELDRDGRLDLVVLDPSGVVTVFRGDGTGDFVAPSTTFGGSGASSILLADLNRDGVDDLVVGGSLGINAKLNDGTGAFGTPQFTATSSAVSTVAVGHFDPDGILDIVAPQSAGYLVAHGDGTGLFSVNSFGAGATVAEIAVGDFDHNATTDIALVESDAGDVEIVLLSATGTPIDTMFLTVPNTPVAALAVDFNLDGRMDVVTLQTGDGTIRPYRAAQPVRCSAGWNGPHTAEGASGLRSVATADFDGDGRVDTAIPTTGSNIRISRGLGDLSFMHLADLSVGGNVLSVAAGDIDHDGDVDLVATNAVGVNATILRNSGNATFATTSYAVGGGNGAVALGDVNNDSHLDAVFVGDNTVYFALGDGFAFAAPTTSVLLNAHSVALGDLNEDGFLDAIVSTSVGGQVIVYFGNAGGLGGSSFFSVGIDTRGVVVSDFNHDKHFDVVAVDRASDTAVFLAGDGTGNLLSPVSYGTLTNPMGIAAADVDRDGETDLIVSHDGGNGIALLRGEPAGTFGSPLPVFGGTDHAVAVNDFTGDGNPDIITPSGVFLYGLGNGTFNLDTPLPNEGGVYVSTDFNRDRSVDVVTMVGTTIAVRPGDGNGHFQPALSSSSTADRFVVADFNADAIADVLTTGPGGWQFHQGLGSGSLASGVSLGINVAANDHVVGDFNLDGDLDLAVTTSAGVSIYPGDGGGGFNTPTLSTLGAPKDLSVGDFDRDGQLDLLVANASSVFYLRGLGNGSFVTPAARGGSTGALGVADFNRDGRLDFVTSTSSTNVQVLFGDGAGGFGTPTTVVIGAQIRALVVGEFDGDGRADFAVTRAISDRITIVSGNGDNSFRPPVSYAIPTQNLLEVTVGDFNRDGRVDVLSNDGLLLRGY